MLDIHDFSDQASSEDEVEDSDGEDGGDEEEEEEEEDEEEEDVRVMGAHGRAKGGRSNAEKLVHEFSAAKRKRIAVFALGDTVSAHQRQIDYSFIEPFINVSIFSPSFYHFIILVTFF